MKQKKRGTQNIENSFLIDIIMYYQGLKYQSLMQLFNERSVWISTSILCQFVGAYAAYIIELRITWRKQTTLENIFHISRVIS